MSFLPATSLPSGTYTITNEFHRNRVRLPNDNDLQSVVCHIPSNSWASSIDDTEKWSLEHCGEDRYTIENAAFKKRFIGTRHSSQATNQIFGTATPYWWKIIQRTADAYIIYPPDNPSLSVSLQDGSNQTPIELLNAAPADRFNLWKISPWPPVDEKEFPYVHDLSVSLDRAEANNDDGGFTAYTSWKGLQQNYILHFPEPILVCYRGHVVAEAHMPGPQMTTSSGLKSSAILHIKDSTAFETFASSVLNDSEIQVVLKARKFKFFTEYAETGRDALYQMDKPVTLKGFRSFREQVLLRDLKIYGSDRDGTYMIAAITANLMNESHIDNRVSLSVGVYVGSTRIGSAELNDLHLQPGSNNVQLEWKLKPRNPVNPDVQAFMNQQFTTNVAIPIALHVENIKTSICGRLFNLPSFNLTTEIQGGGSRLVRKVNAFLGARLLLGRKVSFVFEFANPLDAPLSIRSIELEALVRGVQIVVVKHIFRDPFIIPKKETKQSPKISDAYLIRDYLKSLQLVATRSATLDVTVTSATISVDNFLMEGLRFDLKDIPFSLGVDL
ncbi:hypothetical protein AcW1_009888 [Taiwanofungus camphoratus]|nr:hypothetical protein AcV5_003274 [Antrodia cinnamomea]KAI0946421.1 hypothetical protein AcW1_009888 [Antrodia cinnamomea]